MKNLIFTLIILLMGAQAVMAEEEKERPKLSVYGFADLQGVRDTFRDSDNTDYISLSEVRFGINWKPTKLIEINIGTLTSGDINNGLSVAPGYIYGKVKFSEKVPVYIKAGKWELEYTQSRLIFPFVSDSYVTEAAMQDTAAIEIGFDHEIFNLGFGIADISNDKTASPTKSNDITDFYGFLNFTREHSFGTIFINLGYVTHTGDTALAPATSGKSGAFVVELLYTNDWFHFLGAGSFKVGDESGLNPVKSAYRIEAGGKYKGFFLGAFMDYNDLTVSGKTNGTTSDLRIGGMFGYDLAEGAGIYFEAFDKSYKHNSNKHDNKFTLQFIFDGDFNVKLED